MPEGVQDKDGEQNGPWFQLVQSRENVDSSDDPEDQGTEQQVDGKDDHESSAYPIGVVGFRRKQTFQPLILRLEVKFRLSSRFLGLVHDITVPAKQKGLLSARKTIP